ncbi:ATP-binding cassette domain-containing protein [Rhodoferax sp. 4810]|nr:ATP-binding cassette domain-containing protein [Rhodoferax jenense]
MDALRIISEDHNNLWRLATTVDQLAGDMEAQAKAGLQASQALDTAFFVSVLDYIEQFVERSHHPKEDDYLFRLLRLRNPYAAPTLDALQADHRGGLSRLNILRQSLTDATDGRLPVPELANQLRAYTAAMKTHILTEEKEVMPLARKALRKEDWLEIKRAFNDNRDPLFGDAAQAEFRELYHRIVSLAPESVGLGGHSAGNLPAKALAQEAEVLLRVQGMESCYGRIKALKGITLEVRRGETVALVGANGAGKTTFLRTLSGVQPMSAGSIHFDGDDISKLRSDKRMRRGICQSPEGRQVFGPLSIEDNLRLGAYTQPRHHVQADLEKIFSMFPILKEKRALPAGTLSGGQQQMLAIGRALMGRPSLLLLDEPSMGLAPLLVQEVFEVIKTLKNQGMTILLVEQNALAALDIADRGYVLETGTVTLTGTGQELISNEQVRAAYLGM